MGPKKSLPPSKVKIFIAHPFKWAALWVFPHKNNYIPQHLNNRCINSYNVPVVFMARYVMVFRGATSLRGALEGVGPENRDFLGPEMARAKLVQFGPKP